MVIDVSTDENLFQKILQFIGNGMEFSDEFFALCSEKFSALFTIKLLTIRVPRPSFRTMKQHFQSNILVLDMKMVRWVPKLPHKIKS